MFRTTILHQRPLSIIYDILSLTNSTLLTADKILLCSKKPVPNSWFSFLFPYKNVYSLAGSLPPPSHVTSCTPTKSNLHLDSSLETVIREPALYKLLTFHNPNLMSVFHHLGRFPRESAQVRGSLMTFITNLFFYGKGLLAPRPTPKLENYPLSFVRGCLFNIFSATLHTWGPFLHPHPEDTPCCGDREPT
jgi:hypothetical protein